MSEKSEFNKIRVESEKLLLLDDVLGWDKARMLSVNHKVHAFETLLNFLAKPNSNDIEIIYEEKRYEAFWHVVGTSHFEYLRNHSYRVPVNAEVEDVEILGKKHQVNQDTGNFELEGIEHCREKYREELMIDANTDKPGNFVKYLKSSCSPITSTDELIKDGTPIAHLETRANSLVRTVLGSLVKPIKADKILFEDITVHDLNLYFYPIYTFEYLWKLKNKKATVSFDGVTTAVNLKAAKLTDTLKKSFTSEDLYEFSKEIAQNLVPGGALAMMVGKKVFEMTKKKS